MYILLCRCKITYLYDCAIFMCMYIHLYDDNTTHWMLMLHSLYCMQYEKCSVILSNIEEKHMRIYSKIQWSLFLKFKKNRNVTKFNKLLKISNMWWKLQFFLNFGTKLSINVKYEIIIYTCTYMYIVHYLTIYSTGSWKSSEGIQAATAPSKW